MTKGTFLVSGNLSLTSKWNVIGKFYLVIFSNFHVINLKPGFLALSVLCRMVTNFGIASLYNQI